MSVSRKVIVVYYRLVKVAGRGRRATHLVLGLGAVGLTLVRVDMLLSKSSAVILGVVPELGGICVHNNKILNLISDHS